MHILQFEVLTDSFADQLSAIATWTLRELIETFHLLLGSPEADTGAEGFPCHSCNLSYFAV
jgi:hypothetical protein